MPFAGDAKALLGFWLSSATRISARLLGWQIAMSFDRATEQKQTRSPRKSRVGTGIFVSYRRMDSQGTAGRLCDGLERAFDKQTIFRDIRAISGGMNFVTTIEEALKSCGVLLAIIGPNWLQRLQSFGTRPTDGSTDYVRWELKTALALGVEVIPVLVEGGSMPAPGDLPDELKPLSFLHGHELTDKRWEYDLGELIKILQQHIDNKRKGPGAAEVRLDRRVLLAIGLCGMLLVILAVVIPGGTGATITVLDKPFPSSIGNFAREHAGDGGVALTMIAALMLLLRALGGKYRDELARRFGEWLKSGHAFGVITISLVVVPLLIVFEKLIFAGAAVAVSAAYLAARRFVPFLFTSPRRSGVAAVVAVAVLTTALMADVYVGSNREETFDVAFLLPPEASGVDPAKKVLMDNGVFTEIKHALRVALKDAANVEIVPEQLTEEDFKRYGYSSKDALRELLTYKASKGYARIFIRVKYSLDMPSGMQRVGVTPYLRPVGKTKTLLEPGGWTFSPLQGRVASREVALKTSFELISFLSSRKLIRLEPSELQQVWRNLLQEYADEVVLANADCASVRDELENMQARKELTEEDLRLVLFKPCEDSQGAVNVATTDKAIGTVTALYGTTFGQ